MYPHEGTRRFPIVDHVAFRKPGGRATEVRFLSDIVVYAWIWCRQPTAKVLLALVPYNFVSACPEMATLGGHERSNRFTFTASSCITTSGQLKLILGYTDGPDTPRVSRISFVDALPSTRSTSRKTQVPIRTNHAHLSLLPACC
jgi:hypothetical protein